MNWWKLKNASVPLTPIGLPIAKVRLPVALRCAGCTLSHQKLQNSFQPLGTSEGLKPASDSMSFQ